MHLIDSLKSTEGAIFTTQALKMHQLCWGPRPLQGRYLQRQADIRAKGPDIIWTFCGVVQYLVLIILRIDVGYIALDSILTASLAHFTMH